MKIEFEQELKLLLEREDFEKLRSLYPKEGEPIQQVNYYFDTPDLKLGENRITLRIRYEHQEYEICLKVKTSKSDELISRSSEYNVRISGQEFEAIRQDAGRLLEYLSPEANSILQLRIPKGVPIKLLGSIKNHREFRKGPNGNLLTFDFSEFPQDRVSYELEVENITADAGKMLLEELTAQQIVIGQYKIVNSGQ